MYTKKKKNSDGSLKYPSIQRFLIYHPCVHLPMYHSFTHLHIAPPSHYMVLPVSHDHHSPTLKFFTSSNSSCFKKCIQLQKIHVLIFQYWGSNAVILPPVWTDYKRWKTWKWSITFSTLAFIWHSRTAAPKQEIHGQEWVIQRLHLQMFQKRIIFHWHKDVMSCRPNTLCHWQS